MPNSSSFLALLLAVACPAFAVAPGAPLERATPARSALLIVDAQVGVIGGVWESRRVIENLEKLVSRARSAGVPVIWIQHSDEEDLKYGTEHWKLAPNFVPTPAETVIHKKYNSSFADTDLDQRLRALGVNRVVLAGAATNWCIRSTAYAAMERGYNLALVGDAHSTESIKLPGGKTVAAESIVADLNAVIQWVSVPNVRTEVKTSEDVAF